MAQPLLPERRLQNDGKPTATTSAVQEGEMSDLEIFWGPEICRLEYLVHLLDTGRVKDDCRPRSA